MTAEHEQPNFDLPNNSTYAPPPTQSTTGREKFLLGLILLFTCVGQLSSVLLENSNLNRKQLENEVKTLHEVIDTLQSRCPARQSLQGSLGKEIDV